MKSSSLSNDEGHDADSAIERCWSLGRYAACDKSLPAAMRKSLCRGDVDSLIYASEPLQVKDRCVVGRLESDGTTVLVKRHTWGDLRRTIRMAFRAPSARSCWNLGLKLRKLGLPTPRPLAYVEQRVGPWNYRSYLVTEYVDGVSLYKYVRFGRPSVDDVRHVARQVATIWQRMVELGISHNDMKPENFIVDEKLGVWLIDLEKVRIGGQAHRQKSRQIFDVKNFLHIRSWHRRVDAREIFLEEFLRTPSADWLAEVARYCAEGAANDPELSVLVLCRDPADLAASRRAIESVEDIADEIVIATPNENGRLSVLQRIDPCSAAVEANNHEHASEGVIIRSEWALVLEQNEIVTPFLAKELQQRIVEGRSSAFRLPIERQYFGQTILRKNTSGDRPIRLFRQADCSWSTSDGEASIIAPSESTGTLTGTIQRNECPTVTKFVDRLNERASVSAQKRFAVGERPAGLVRLAARVVARAIRMFASHRGLRSGFAGLKLAALEGVFAGVEEARLRELNCEFPMHRIGETQRSNQADEPTASNRTSALSTRAA